MRILALDLGKASSVACDYDTAAPETHAFRTVPTTPQALHDLLTALRPDRVVLEVGTPAGWVRDLCLALGQTDVQVVNPDAEPWRWRNVKRKTDRDDALKLARLSAGGEELDLVILPSPQVRQWRSLIGCRHKLVRQRTRVKNAIRALLDLQGLPPCAPRAAGWTRAALARLTELSKPLADAAGADLWRGQLDAQLENLRQLSALIGKVTDKLDAVAAADPRVGLLRSIPGVGPRLAELIVATIDDPHRFATGRQVAAYAGLVPRKYQTGATDRNGRVTRRGNPLLRALLVEVAWLCRRHNPWLKDLHDHITGGSKTRKKVAIIAVARRLLVVCWAMLRDNTRWRQQPGASTATTSEPATVAAVTALPA